MQILTASSKSITINIIHVGKTDISIMSTPNGLDVKTSSPVREEYDLVQCRETGSGRL